MHFDEQYRGYGIRYRQRKAWIANIWPPLGLFSLQAFPTASKEEGRSVVQERARAFVDTHIIATGTDSAGRTS